MGCTASHQPASAVPVNSKEKTEIPSGKNIVHKDMSLLREMVREESVHSAVTDGSNLQRTEGSNIQRAKSWVRDDLGFKAHLARVNDITELEKKFELGEILGEGITGQVRLCRSKIDFETYAMKSLNVSRMDEAQIAELKAEIETLKRLDHPNIINLMEVFEAEDNICIIMDHCSGGDLSQRRFVSENDVCSVVFQLCEAVAHCHHNGIVHRDLKMENIMFVSKDSDSIRLIDFGLSKKFLTKDEIIKNDKILAQNDKCRVMKTACGTAFYMAPEMLTMSYSEKADIWALGVITYMLITGRPPFEGKDENAVFERVRRGRVHYNEKVWSRLSPEALEFTKALLQFNPDDRPSAKETLELPWLANYQKRRKSVLDGKDGKIFGKEVCESLLRFASYPPLKRAALMVVSHHVREQDTRDLRNMFLTLDEDHSGELTFDEMFNMIKKYSSTPVSEEYFRTVFDEMDYEKTGRVHYMEFLAATLESRVKISGHLLNTAFDHLDVESSGAISIDNLKQLLGKNFSREKVESIIRQAHHSAGYENDDEVVVTRADFIQMMGDAQLPSPSPTPSSSETPTPNVEFPSGPPSTSTPPANEDETTANGGPMEQHAMSIAAASKNTEAASQEAKNEKKEPADPVKAPTPNLALPPKIPSLRKPGLPALIEESGESLEASRLGTPLPYGQHSQWPTEAAPVANGH